VCKNIAGLRTTHPDWGKCYICEKERGKRLYMSLTRLNDKVKEITGEEIYPQVQRGLEVAKVLGGRMDSLEEEVEIVSALLIDMLIDKEKKDEMSTSDKFKIIDVIKELRNLKEAQFRIKKESALDLRVITAFIDKIFNIISQSLDTTQARELMEKIKIDAIAPIGSLTGKEEEKINSDVTKSIDSNLINNMFEIENIEVKDDSSDNIDFEEGDFDNLEITEAEKEK
jgi:hypothetical protein